MWGQSTPGITTALLNAMNVVERIRSKPKGVEKRTLALNMFYAGLSIGNTPEQLTKIYDAEPEIENFIDAIVELENKLTRENKIIVPNVKIKLDKP
jgi:hypothetical protein